MTVSNARCPDMLLCNLKASDVFRGRCTYGEVGEVSASWASARVELIVDDDTIMDAQFEGTNSIPM